jgi:acyl carrier protein
MNDINIELAEILELELVFDTDVLDDFDLWDSLAFLSVAAFVDTNYNVQIDTGDFEDLKTVLDIKELVKLKK